MTFPGIVGTPEENLALSTQRLEQMAAEKEEKTALIAAESVNRSALQLGADTLLVGHRPRRGQRQAAPQREHLLFRRVALRPGGGQALRRPGQIRLRLGDRGPRPGASGGGSRQAEKQRPDPAYNVVTEMYSLPAYNGLDPNPFLMPFFALFFGMMFADMAYGLLLLIAGLIFTFKAKPRGTMKNMAVC